jgi:branched-subunit amino acid aminotransferase/4-amino-4-deoxychorismate lyase
VSPRPPASNAEREGLLETILSVRGRPVQQEAHFERLASSAAALSLPSPSAGQFARAAGEAAASLARLDEAALRVTWIGNGPDAASWELSATAAPLPPVVLARRSLGRAISVGAHTPLSPHKRAARPMYDEALRRAIDAGADEALFAGAAGRLLEGTSTNLFAVDGETIITAPLESEILPGIVRGWIVANALRLGLRVVERPPSVEELLRGGFLTSSLTLFAPLRSLDGEPCSPPGEPFARLAAAYRSELIA